ncbi:hypothetical protein M9458_006534, partial [Cirrhinus mrigala]
RTRPTRSLTPRLCSITCWGRLISSTAASCRRTTSCTNTTCGASNSTCRASIWRSPWRSPASWPAACGKSSVCCRRPPLHS